MKITLTTEYYSDSSYRMNKSKESLEARAASGVRKNSPTNPISKDKSVSDVKVTLSGEQKKKKDKNFKKYLQMKNKRNHSKQ